MLKFGTASFVLFFFVSFPKLFFFPFISSRYTKSEETRKNCVLCCASILFFCVCVCLFNKHSLRMDSSWLVHC